LDSDIYLHAPCDTHLDCSSLFFTYTASHRHGLPEWVELSVDGARPVHLIITMIKWIRTSRLSIKNSLSLEGRAGRRVVGSPRAGL